MGTKGELVQARHRGSEVLSLNRNCPLMASMRWLTFRSMGREAEPVYLTEADLIEFANALRIVAAMIDADVETMRRKGTQSIAPKMWKTAVNASADLSKFAGALRTAIALENFPLSESPRDERDSKSQRGPNGN